MTIQRISIQQGDDYRSPRETWKVGDGFLLEVVLEGDACSVITAPGSSRQLSTATLEAIAASVRIDGSITPGIDCSFLEIAKVDLDRFLEAIAQYLLNTHGVG